MRLDHRRRPGSKSPRWIGMAALFLLAVGCNDGSGAGGTGGGNAGSGTGGTNGANAESGSGGTDNAKLIKRGKVVYETVCTACHARAPREDGPIGPTIAGASLELLEAKVLRNEYPPGYTPKRDTKAMVPFPHVEPDLPAVHAYLATFAE